ncbi:unnamed protein product [Vitrella brassicaformis CCMP3155]|uniref:Uncharacterized protein n=3 Tax=Vitrella brassicaformis TaxID=1169539 RepID=A0A0G4FAG4_VITBC|nr:unnamed protein product [Vitrella brassicaformis CCMP3155]|mmetsp:Transcript_18375/g.52459  ORF Transcript_18375/g.52459 Transcript_18375/m.52459 type:complete len:629 (-) Transcript_18375:3167-5053(-)|eukprot:CEM09422.1 unnamed protein product [Vitrella brassicaformis CCMP3155]
MMQDPSVNRLTLGSSIAFASGAAIAYAVLTFRRKKQHEPPREALSKALYEKASMAIDKVHDNDPSKTEDSVAKELKYADSIIEWITKVVPEPSLTLLLAGRAQHFERWAIPRNTYPMDKPGYLRWRADVKKRQGQRIREVFAAIGISETVADRVGALVAKATPASDPDAQALEDAACLVFLAEQSADFSADKDDAKMIGILQKTWVKMSAQGHLLALELPLPSRLLALILIALKPPPSPPTAEKTRPSTRPSTADSTTEAPPPAFSVTHHPPCPLSTESIAEIKEFASAVSNEWGDGVLERLETAVPGLKAMWAGPLRKGGTVKGVLEALIDRSGADGEVELLQALADHMMSRKLPVDLLCALPDAIVGSDPLLLSPPFLLSRVGWVFAYMASQTPPGAPTATIAAAMETFMHKIKAIRDSMALPTAASLPALGAAGGLCRAVGQLWGAEGWLLSYLDERCLSSLTVDQYREVKGLHAQLTEMVETFRPADVLSQLFLAATQGTAMVHPGVMQQETVHQLWGSALAQLSHQCSTAPLLVLQIMDAYTACSREGNEPDPLGIAEEMAALAICRLLEGALGACCYAVRVAEGLKLTGGECRVSSRSLHSTLQKVSVHLRDVEQRTGVFRE